MSNDTGHRGGSSDASFASRSSPEVWVDLASRAVHDSTVQAKAVIGVLYGRAPKFSYWLGCSSGGR